MPCTNKSAQIYLVHNDSMDNTTTSFRFQEAFKGWGNCWSPRCVLDSVACFLIALCCAINKQSFMTPLLQMHDAILLQIHDAVLLQIHDAVLLQIYDAVLLQNHDAILLQIHDAVLLQIHDTVLLQSHDAILLQIPGSRQRRRKPHAQSLLRKPYAQSLTQLSASHL